MGRSRFAMLRACRAARSGRILLLAAALLALAGSFGLHPEPILEDPAASSSGPEWNAGISPEGASHGCMACLAHRTVSLTGLTVFVPFANSPLAAPEPPPVQPIRRLTAPSVDGRAPPLPA